MAQVSLYKNIRDTKNGHTVLLGDVLDNIKAGRWAAQINQLRTTGDKAIKESLPYFTGSGTFKERRDNGLDKHSGRIIIDFDHLPNIEQARKILQQDQYTEALFASCSGTGLAVVVKIDGSKHRESFALLERYYKQTYNLKADPACKDVSRPRYISFDPELYMNHDSKKVELPKYQLETDDEKYDWILEKHNKKFHFIEGERHHYLVRLAFFLNKAGVTQSYAEQRMVAEFSNKDKTPEEIENIVRYCYTRQSEHGTFIIHNKNNEVHLPFINEDEVAQVYAYAHGVNRAGRKYQDADIQHNAQLYLMNPNFVRDIFKYIFENHKDEHGIDNKPEIARVEVFLNRRWDFARNEVTQRNEYKEKGAKEFKPLSADTIYREMQHAGFKFTMDKLKSLLRSSFVKSFNPFHDYFNALPEWDGVDHITNLANHITTDAQEFYLVQFKKALVRSIACTVDLKENRIVFVFVGEKQNTGKSTFIRFLNPFRGKYYTESPLRDNKDSEFRFSENFIYNMEELSSLSNMDVNKLKAIISKAVIKERKPYAEQEEEQPRRCNFWASTNKSEFLTDTENTRWLCFNILGIDWNYKAATDIDKVWAQAWHLYKNGFEYQLSREEEAQRDEINKNYEVTSPEIELVHKYFAPGVKTNPMDRFLTATEIMHEIIKHTDNQIRLVPVAIGRALVKHGFKRTKRGGIWGYWTTKPGTEQEALPF